MSPARGPDAPEPVSRSLLIVTALEIVEREGLEAVAMRRLSKELGVWPAAVYHHVSSKDALHDAVCDAVVRTVAVPRVEQDVRWRDWQRELAVELYRVFARYPGVALRYLTRGPVGTQALTIIEASMGVLVAGGFDDAEAVMVHGALFNHVAWSAEAHRLARLGTSYADALAEFARIAGEEPSPRPMLQRAIRGMMAVDQATVFEVTLDAMLDGFAGQLERSRRA